MNLLGSITFESQSIEFSQSLGLTSLSGSAMGYSYDPYAVEIGTVLTLTDGANSVEVVVREVEAVRSGNQYEIHVKFSDRMDEITRQPVVYDEFDNINGKNWQDILTAVRTDVLWGWTITSEAQ